MTIICTSNTGFTREYADMLSGHTGYPVYTLEEAKLGLPKGAPVIYMGWLRAGGIVGLKKAVRRYKVRIVCAVGMQPADTVNIQSIAERNKLKNAILCYLPGGLRPDRLRGINGSMLRMVSGAIIAQAKKDQSPYASEIEEMFRSGGSYVKQEHLDAVCLYCGKE